MRILRVAAPLSLVLVLLFATSADAATTYTDALSGIEYFATSTEGFFTGTASGDLPGTFDTQVIHTPLDTTATITGGSFTLYTVIGGNATTVTGMFASGTVSQVDKNKHGCRDQHFAVSGTLTNAGVDGSGTGTFEATLTHYRTRVGAQCITYFATIIGSVSLIF